MPSKFRTMDASILLAYVSLANGTAQDWFRFAHLLGLFAWFAGMFYIWRLFVYARETEVEQVRGQLVFMARKLYRIIMTPALWVALAAGFSLLFSNWNAYMKGSVWMHIKLTLVVLLVGHHHLAGFYIKQFEAGKKPKSGKYFRFMNELPTLVLIFVLILVIFKPF